MASRSVSGPDSSAGEPSGARRRVATLLVWTTRSTPAARAALMALVTPSTLFRTISSGSRAQSR